MYKMKYRTTRTGLGIEQVLIIHQNEKKITYQDSNGAYRIELVAIGWGQYHDSWQEARDYLLDRLNTEKLKYQSMAQRLEQDIATVKRLCPVTGGAHVGIQDLQQKTVVS